MSIAECAPSIRRLYTDLRKGKPIPTCEEATMPDGSGAYARAIESFYDPCPEGTRALPEGIVAVQATRAEAGYWGLYGTTEFRGIGEGDDLRFSGEAMPTKVCVGNPVSIGAFGSSYSSGSPESPYTVFIFDRITLIPPIPPGLSPLAFDVFIDGKLYSRYRP